MGSGGGTAIGGFRSILPPLLAILLALISREVILALLGGIWLGASYLADGHVGLGLLRTLDHHLVNSLADSDHAFILLFSLTLGGMVGIIGASGGAAGIVKKVGRWAKSPRSGQISCWAMGLLIFFDDYANTLVVGNTFRPLTDKLRISREKLSFIVDATAAPVASIALISTWIGFEVGLIADGLVPSGALSDSTEAYGLFIQTIPYRFYPLFMLLLVFMIGFWNRDFGPMLTAERRCRTTGQVLREGAAPLGGTEELDTTRVSVTEQSWLWGIIPVLTVIIATLAGLYFEGKASLGAEAEDAAIYTIISSANSFAVLMWAAFMGSVTAGLLATWGAKLSVAATVRAFVDGIKAMTAAAIVLILAWAIGGICRDLKTADYVVEISQGILAPQFIPAVTFVISAVIAFATGTSWGTLSILMPIIAPIAYIFPIESGLSAGVSQGIMVSSVGAVLAGSVFGDHSSPISDTTIMSSMASGADHIDHVRTQIPYALLAGAAALVFGYIPAGFGVSPWISLLVGGFAVVLTLRFVGKKVE
ncbi:Na+/H+ antiporter NhaC family protein [bacterium]|nr:Na+/H+ antiporter NhaC family protein [bacterium]MBU1882540.1 Na+/H+ antiporter NhaC family protein [bacterium]